MSFFNFIEQLGQNRTLLFTVILTLLVILVNGWTDAPNAIATCVTTRSMKVNHAVLMASVFNFLGVLLMSMINTNVAETIYNMVDFGGNIKNAHIALCAALVAIVTWAVAAWVFGIPTSESHALIAGLSGAAIALANGLEGIHLSEWKKVLYGLALSTILGVVFGGIMARLNEFLFKNANRIQSSAFFDKAQILSAACMAFMHGAQDGQKFIGVFMLGVFLAKGQSGTAVFHIPIWLMFVCSAVMGIGTSIGGVRIIKTVGVGMVKLEKYQGFAADSAGALCLLISSLIGIPVSTTHTKAAAILGVGAVKRLSRVNWNVVGDMVLTWILTFPGCGIIGFIMAKWFLNIFV